MEMMAKYYSVILSPDQLGSVGVFWLILIAAVFIFNLNKWLSPPEPKRNDDDLLRKVAFHLPSDSPEKHKRPL
jgi:hypothetical protein